MADIKDLSRETLEMALLRAERIITWMAPDIGRMCPPDGGLAELNEHFLFTERCGIDTGATKRKEKT